MEKTRSKEEEIAYLQGYHEAMKELLLKLMGKSERLEKKINRLIGEE